MPLALSETWGKILQSSEDLRDSIKNTNCGINILFKAFPPPPLL